jgi:hypothetical protein
LVNEGLRQSSEGVKENLLCRHLLSVNTLPILSSVRQPKFLRHQGSRCHYTCSRCHYTCSRCHHASWFFGFCPMFFGGIGWKPNRQPASIENTNHDTIQSTSYMLYIYGYIYQFLWDSVSFNLHSTQWILKNNQRT